MPLKNISALFALRSLLSLLQSSGKVNGVALIYNSTFDRPEEFSHEDSCPNRYSGLSLIEGQTCGIDGNKEWNPVGTSVLMMDWQFPIFYVTEQTHIENIYDVSKPFLLQFLFFFKKMQTIVMDTTMHLYMHNKCRVSLAVFHSKI